LLLNFSSVVALRRNDYDSVWAGLGWVASLVLLAAAFFGDQPRDQAREATSGVGVEERTDLRLPRAAEIAIVLTIFALALGLRLYRLGDWSGGMHGDEGEVGMDALRILSGQPTPPFRTGWFGQPNFYYWGVAIGMKLFGTGLTGLRMFSTLAGALIILPFYALVRQLFGVRTAILAGIFLAISDVAIHFSREEFSNITTPLLLVSGFFLFFRGLRNRRPIFFVLAGYAHESCLYFYLGGRLTPIIAAAFVGYLLVLTPVARLYPRYRNLRAGDPRPSRVEAALTATRGELNTVRPYVLCVLLYAIASLSFATPWIAYYRDHQRMLDARVHEKLFIRFPDQLAKEYKASHDPLYLGVRAPQPGDGLPLPIVFERTRVNLRLAEDGFWPRVIWGQLKRTLSILTYHFDASGVYTFTKEPVTKPIEATLIVLGLAWALWRWRDTRMALLSLWFWLTILVGGVMTIDAPYMARLVGIIPVLALLAAVVLDKLATELVRVCGGPGRSPRRARLGQAVSGMALLALAGFLTWQNATDYYGRYLAQRPFAETVGQASFVRDLNVAAGKERRPPPKYYDLGAHFIYWGHAVNRFLNRETSGQDVANASDSLPILDNDDRDAVFMVWDVQKQYLPLFRAYYPEAQEGQYFYGPPGHESPLFTYYRVNRDQIEARRKIPARYVPARGAPIERREGSLGLSGPAPAGLIFPVRARWKGNLVVPSFGRYRLRLESSGQASLALDDEPVLAARGGTAPERDVVLARGVHAVSLDATLARSDSTVRVQWSAGDSTLRPVPRRFLWAGSGGSLLGEVRSLPELGRGNVGPSVPSLCGSDAMIVTQRRVDGFLGFRDAPGALQLRLPLAACWKGDLRIVRPGEYQFEVFSNGGSMIVVDGHPVVDNRHAGGPPRAGAGQIALTPGTHRFEVGYSWVREIGYLEVYWTPPGGERALIGGEELSAKGGHWWLGQVDEPVSPAARLIHESFVPAEAPPSSLPRRTPGARRDRRDAGSPR
jgi:Dolichyl-phosphate-mannose-protein mannosyltransferase